MNQEVKVIYETSPVIDNIEKVKTRLMNNKVIAGKMAGICYMSEDYLDKGIQDEDKALKRADGTANSGHYSTYEHGHITLLLKTTKMMAIILNSLNFYSASEKSGRYTIMNPESELEINYYNKWMATFELLIRSYNKDGIYTHQEIKKLAMENTRYMVSVFTPTVLAYTVPYSRAVLTVHWLYDLANRIAAEKEDDLAHAKKEELPSRNNFYKNMIDGVRDLADKIKEQLGFDKDHELILDDHKKIGIELFSTVSFSYKTEGMNEDDIIKNPNDYTDKYHRRSYYGNVYVDNYTCSYAALAQEVRHRTLHYQIYKFNGFDCCYIPKIIKNTPYENEWIENYNNLILNGVIPQCTLVDVIEEGRFEDWVLKCKERLCSRAQLEICDITVNQVKNFVKDSNNLCYQNKLILDDMVSSGIYEKEKVKVKPRCRFCNYKCKEPCKQANSNILYNRIV